jgi:DNA-binding MarR family transcriptional regulator
VEGPALGDLSHPNPAETTRYYGLFQRNSAISQLFPVSNLAAPDRLDWRTMIDTEPQVTELAEGLHQVLMKLVSVLRRGDANRATVGDLTLAQLSILVTLIDRGPIRMTDLAAHERVRTPTTTVAIRRLEKLGLVKRSKDQTDLRAVLVDITEKGLAVHRESLANRRAALAAMLRALSDEDRATLAKALEPLERLAGPSVI